MSDQDRGPEPDAGTGTPEEEPGDERGGAKRGFSDGIKQGLGVLSAFKEALEETIHDARERGDLSAERAREMVQGAMSRAREAAGEAKERLDFATQQDLDALGERVEELRVRLENLERRVPQDPSAGPSRPSGEGAGDG
ncbi:MAG TPA: hypothetical protein VLL48_09570 [Longimicrobiales bacterium]|nr:hypothetical protein [Longimicrobiales bacterium]